MSPSTASLLTHRFRTGESFELVVFDRLPLAEQAMLQELRADPQLYGVLRPRHAEGLTVKAVDRATALLLLTLREPGPLPFFVFEGPRQETEEGIEQLVLDRLLEVEVEGCFLAGAAVLPALCAMRPENEGAGAEDPAANGIRPPAPSGRLAQVSAAALRHAERADEDEPERLAALLYGFNREPLTPGWASRLPDAQAVLAFLGAAPGTPLARALFRVWEHGERESAPGWIFFAPRRGAERRSDAVPYKLYVSPQAEALPHAFAAVAAALGKRGDHTFKVGSDAAGVLRPDKLVLYFQELETLLAVARELEGALAGLPAQGVPFTAPIDAAGLLSWGVDPPAAAPLAAWHGPESWRQWVARRLAGALLAARGAAPADASSAAVFALERVRREGVDVERWTPTATLWAAA